MTTYQTSAAKPSFFSPGAALLLLLVVIGAAAAAYRIFYGLGTSTKLSDEFPWGLWVMLDVLIGIALAAGGFTIAAAAHLFNLDEYKPIARQAVLTAFIGYLIASAGLLLDIGKPLAFWHPLVMWQPHSMLFEIIWCMVLYTTVLALEFAPAALEGLKLEGMAKVLRAKALVIPLVILAATLSFFHQSSLGGLFLLMKGRLSALWWTTMLPYNFFLSAVAAGLAMTCLEVAASGWMLRHPVNVKTLQALAKGTAWTLLLYAVFRLGDLALKGNLGLAFAGTLSSQAFLLEVVGGVLLPMLLLFVLSKSKAGILLGQSLVIAGIVLNRLNVAYFTQAHDGATYLPSCTEMALSLGLIAGVILLFKAAAVHLPIITPAKS